MVVTITLPVVAPEGTCVVILLEAAVIICDSAPLKLTWFLARSLANPSPLIFTIRVIGPEAGNNEESIGLRARTPKLVVTEPLAVLTVTIVLPRRASLLIAKTAFIEVLVTLTPLIVIPELSVDNTAPVRLAPVIVTFTEEPRLPERGLIDVIVGAWTGVVDVSTERIFPDAS